MSTPDPRDPRELFDSMLRVKLGDPMVKRNYRFYLNRLWMFDYALVSYKIGIDIASVSVAMIGGDAYALGPHVRVKGFRDGCMKAGSAQIMGWIALTFDLGLILDGTAIDMVLEALKNRGWKHG